MTTGSGQGGRLSQSIGTKLEFGVGEHHRVGDDELANNIPPGCDNLG